MINVVAWIPNYMTQKHRLHHFMIHQPEFGHLGVSIVMGVPQNGWLIRENLIKMDDLGVPPFMETPI